MKEKVRQRALDLGFDACRFTTAQAPPHGEQLVRWLAEGRHGEMGYLERNAQKRVDPQQVLPDARSILALAISYGRDDERVGWAEPSRAGVIARYARSTDYHTVVGDKLGDLVDFLEQNADGPSRSLWYVDTGPILERDLAERAGLGFIGKHTNLINRTLGNWIFLAEVITTVAFEPDAPEKNRCGSCARCITACPTAAITAPFQLDARRCISYLTIELKGPIPIEFRRAVGNRIYGCDDCLAACPWNRFARQGAIMKGHHRLNLSSVDLIELLSLDDAAFRERFAGTPMLRTRRRGLLRNACVALGNVGDSSALPALSHAAADPEPLIAEHALWAIQEIKQRLDLPA